MACDVRLDLRRFCGRMVEREEAIRQRWTASFFARGHTTPSGVKRWYVIDQPTCPDCAESHLRFCEKDGVYELRPDHFLPDDLN
jgi:hypothetical protein